MSLPPSPPSASAPDAHFPDTLVLTPGLSADTHALLAGDLGDPSYRIDSFAESLDLMRRVAQSHQAATLVVLKPDSEAPEPLLAFSARVAEVSEDTQSMEMDLPLGSAFVPKGLTLRGSVRLQGVIVTFECETLGSRHGADGLTGVLVARMPFRLYRLQRRDSFRVPLTPQSGVSITLKAGVRPLENIKALDLSCGGVSVLLRALDDDHVELVVRDNGAGMSEEKRGGPGRGQGRKPVKQGEETVTFSLRMTPEQRAKLARLGGAEWVRCKIDSANENNPADEPTR